MGTVLIRCPQTKSYVFTGISLDRETFYETDLGPRTVLCTDCGKVHRWHQKDAWLQDWPKRE